MFAEVVVDTYQDPSKKAFTYAVPEEMEKRIKEGAKVLVPFGKRSVEGYIFGIGQERPPFPTRKIKEVRGVTFTINQVRLARWMSKYYVAPPLDCLKCQLTGRGQQYTEGKANEIETLLLVPYATKVRLRALELSKSERKTTLVGSRSSVFAPLPNLKRIIVEEPESWIYKDERSPYYHTKDIAQKRAEFERLNLELRYLVPRVEDFYAERLNPRGLALNPGGLVEIVDMMKERNDRNASSLARDVIAVLEHPKQSLLFVNSHEAKTRVYETIHEQNLDSNLFEITGVEIFGQLGKQFATSVIVDADTLFNLPDFRSHERLLLIVTKLTQLTKGAVFIQTSNAAHPLFEELKTGDLSRFYRRELESRKPLRYPPFGAVAKLEFSSKTSAKVESESQKLYEKLSTMNYQLPTIFVSPPYPPYAKTRGKAQLNIAVKAKSRQELEKVLTSVPPEWRIIVDPESLL